jgi:hypothetical protein
VDRKARALPVRHSTVPGVNADPHLQPERTHRVDDAQTGCNCRNGFRENREEPVAARVHLLATKARDLGPYRSVVSFEQFCPGRVAESDRPLCRADNIGEQTAPLAHAASIGGCGPLAAALAGGNHDQRQPLLLGIAATNAAPQSAKGLDSALLTTGQQLGFALGYAILSGIASSATTSYLASHNATLPQALARAQVHGYRAAFLVATAIALGCAGFALYSFAGDVARRSRSCQVPDWAA